jgi:hypothetical protein
MKKFLIVAFMFSVAVNMEAQRLDLDKLWFNCSYRRLPNIVLDQSYKTYIVTITKSVALDAYSNESANNMINIEGKKKVSSGEYFAVNVNMSDLIIEQSEVTDRVVIHTDKDGKETGRSYYYRVTVKYSFDASAQVKDYKGNVLANYRLAARDSKQTFQTPEVGKSADAASYYNNNQLEIKTSLVSEQINKALNSLNSSLNNDFGYRVINARENLWSIGSQKHPEYQPFQEACETGRTVIEMVTADVLPEEAKEKAKPACDYFESIVKKYTNAEEKAEKKIRYGAYYNMAVIYLYTEQFDRAKEFAQKLIANDYDTKDGETIIKVANEIIEQFGKHQMNTRHFVPDLENIQARQ